MQTVDQLSALRSTLETWRLAGQRIAFVPTMGNLHAGHHSLIRLARERADRVVASVFVNPTQFGPNEDYGRYPRTPEADAEGLRASGCDLLWLPSVETMYPFGAERTVQVRVPQVTETLEGAHRPGHFDGVATVVARLFNQVRPDVAVFGRKDYQQLAVIRYLVRDLAFPIEIVGADTRREADGLALSSRNQYLSESERPQAVGIHACLQWMREASQAGQARVAVEAGALERLSAAGFVVDYAAIRRPDLSLPEAGQGGAGEGGAGEGGARVALIAARLGRTRLIDNLEFET
ncbi:pantoate--beta-alanine ligase [Lysobacter sp. CA196]|uniref:pantoate--beta-alanine ligase n=1 Tax=Lysobacter sp. CA196 TaxID=3455606 RepID=UPI003F8D024B